MSYSVEQTHDLTPTAGTNGGIKVTGWIQTTLTDDTTGDTIYASPNVPLPTAGVEVPADGTDVVLIPQQAVAVGTRTLTWSAKGHREMRNGTPVNKIDVDDTVDYDGASPNTSFVIPIAAR